MNSVTEIFNHARDQVSHDEQPPATEEWPFRPLGFDKDFFHIYSSEGQQVVSLPGRALTSAGELMRLAPLFWFEGKYTGRDGFNARSAANDIIRACYKAGVYNPDAVRGRGVWLDEGRQVLHLGHQLLVDGIPTDLDRHTSKFIYERGRAMAVTLGPPLTDLEGRALLKAACEVAWLAPERDGRLLMGWIVSAVVGGALKWRPHIWLLAEAGEGKSWVMDNIVRPLLGPLALVVQSKTSEAGLRGLLGRDVRPVLFDEAETQSEADRARIQQVIDLSRAASTADNGEIVKGTKEGGSRSYSMRASFLFGSIVGGLTQSADISRFATLPLVAGNPIQFDALREAMSVAMVEGIGGRFIARCLQMIPTIIHNAAALKSAIARTGAGDRAGDTLGTLIACAMSLVDGTRLDREGAEKFLAARDWLQDAAHNARPVPEYERAWNILMQAEGLRWTRGKVEAYSVSELISICHSFASDAGPSQEEAQDALRRKGIRIRDGHLLVANQSEFVAAIFKPTDLGTGWNGVLARIPGTKTGEIVRFTPHFRSRSLAIPLARSLED